MKQFDERHWKSKFARFLRSYDVDELAAQLDIQPSAIYHWLRGTTAPRPVHAENIQRLARERGARLTMDAIYGHFLSLRADYIKPETGTIPSRAAGPPLTDLPSRAYSWQFKPPLPSEYFRNNSDDFSRLFGLGHVTCWLRETSRQESTWLACTRSRLSKRFSFHTRIVCVG